MAPDKLRWFDWLSPRLDSVQTPADVARVRQAVLQEAASTLRGDDSHPQVDPQDTALAAALPIIHDLVLSLAETARTRLPPQEQEVFMDALRQHVAGAVTELAGEQDKPSRQ